MLLARLLALSSNLLKPTTSNTQILKWSRLRSVPKTLTLTVFSNLTWPPGAFFRDHSNPSFLEVICFLWVFLLRKIFWKKFTQTQYLFCDEKLTERLPKSQKFSWGGSTPISPTYCSRNILKNLKTLPMTICNIHLKWNLYVWSTFDNNPTVQSKLFLKKSLEPHKAQGGQVRLEKTVRLKSLIEVLYHRNPIHIECHPQNFIRVLTLSRFCAFSPCGTF